MNVLEIKSVHEKAACCNFLSIYNLKQGSNFNFLRPGNPNDNEPDCICSNNLGIELVGIYSNTYHAVKTWDSVRGNKIKRQPEFILLTLENLQKEVGKKLQKLEIGNYSGFSGKIILVCKLHSPLLQDIEIKQYVETYSSFR